MTHEIEAEAAQIERILDELRAMVDPAAWLRVEHALRITTQLYGAGLRHMLEHAIAAGSDRDVLAVLADGDDLLASLLLLHGLHPLATESRVRRAVVELRAELGQEIEVIVAGKQRVSLRAPDGLGGGAMSARVAESIIRRAVEAAAPEVEAIDIAGLPPPPEPPLVQLRARKEAP